MKWPNDTKDFALPVRDVDVGQPAESGMRLGVSGIRTVEWTQNDGSVVRLSHRGGHPIYETVEGGAGSQAAENYRRGFVAVVPGATTGTLFNPYTLAVVQHGFKPAGALYYVLDYATDWNVSPSDTTNWRDVIVFDGNKILINGLRMAPPLQDLASVPAGGIPYFINTGLSGGQYGRPQDRRTFAVARELVKSWASAGITETLTPTTPRVDEKALTLGPAIVRSTHKAWLGQMYYTGTSATDDAGTWAFSQREVNMMLASPFLSGTNSSASVDMTPPSLTSAGTSSGSISTDVTLPDTPVGMTGVAELRQDNPYDGSRAATVVVWGFDTQISRPLQGLRSGSYSRLTYTGSQSSTETQAGIALDYSGSNTKYWDSRSEHYTIKAQLVPMADAPTSTYTYMGMSATATDIFYAVSPGDIYPRRNKTERYVSGGGHYPDSYHSRNYEVQTAAFSVSTPLFDLVTVSIYRESSSGQLVELSPNMTYYPPYFGPYYYHVSGMGSAGRVELNYDYNPGNDTFPVGDTYKQNPSPPPNQLPAVIAEVEALRTAMRDAHMAAIFYDDESSSGDTERPYGGNSFYYASVNPSVDLLSQTLTWQTSDFILFDEDNGVYIRIDGEFSGQDTDATLTVSLVIETRHDTTTVQLLTRDYTYGDLLPEYEIGSTGKYAIPSPQVRAMFAPLYREQGSFKGAHYVTQAEEGLGATPAHLFNFRLILHTLSDVGEVNELNATDTNVHFVPFNLLEMLYCFVFSQDYGVGASTGQRYPVTFTTRFNDLATNLFGVPFDVAVRDGTIGDWTHALHSSFVGVHGASLHRV